MSKHTPGPWTYEARESVKGSPHTMQGIIYAEKDKKYIADVLAVVEVFWYGTKTVPYEANGKLIAAAPDYDAAARNLARFKDAGERIPASAWQQLYDAIEKATP